MAIAGAAIAAASVGAAPAGAAYARPVVVGTYTGQAGQHVKRGNPWHGPIVGNVLTLPNGGTRAVKGADVGIDTWYVKKPGIAAVTTTPEEAAAGMEWRNDAVLCGTQKTYLLGPAASVKIGANRWVYFAPSGKRWLMEASCIGPGFGTGNPPPASVNVDVTVKVIAEFGRFDAAATPPLNQTIYAATLTASPTYCGPAASNGYHTTDRRMIAHSPSGAKAIAHYQVVSNYCGFRAVKMWQIDLSEPTPGAVPAASVSVFKSEADCCSYASATVYEPYYATGYNWGGQNVEIRESRQFLLCALFGTSETPDVVSYRRDERDYTEANVSRPGQPTIVRGNGWRTQETTLTIGATTWTGGMWEGIEGYLDTDAGVKTIVRDRGERWGNHFTGDCRLYEISNNVFLVAAGLNTRIYCYGHPGEGWFGDNTFPTGVIHAQGGSEWKYYAVSPGGFITLPDTYASSNYVAWFGESFPLPTQRKYSWDMRSNTIRQCDGHI